MDLDNINSQGCISTQNPNAVFDDHDFKQSTLYNNIKIRSNSCSPNSSIKKRNSLPISTKENEFSKKDCMKKEFLLFCQNTTIRGVSRIVKSTEKKIFFLWLGFFIILCIGLLVCMILLLSQYLDYNVIHPPRVLSNKQSPFPSFTICNLRPLSPDIRSFLKNENLRNPREFAVHLNKYALNLYLKKNETNKYSASTTIASMGGYLESMPNTSYFNKLGHGLNETVISCKVNYVEGSSPILDNCLTVGRWRTILHPQYINCYSFVLHEKFSLKSIAVELFIYLGEEVNTTDCIDCFFSNVKTQLSGAVLVIHNRASFPDINQYSVNLQPGTLTEVKLKTIKNLMKTPPYGRCSKKAQEHLYISNEDYTYSEGTCKFVTLQKKINEECKCNVIDYPFIGNPSFPFCTSLPHFIQKKSCTDFNAKSANFTLDENCVNDLERALKGIICKNNVTRRYHGDGIEGCYLPCIFYSYETDRSISTWPTKSYHLKWLQSSAAKSIKNKPELKSYQEAMKKLNDGDEAAAFNIISNQNMLEKKLVGIVINKPDYNLHVVEEKEVLSLTSFLSQSGGLFSIWIGLTMINIVELIEMLIRISEIDNRQNEREIKTIKSFEIRSQPCSSNRSRNIDIGNCSEELLESLTGNNQLREAVI